MKEDAPEYVWMTQYRHIFNSSTFAEVKYTGWWGFYDLNPTTDVARHFDGLTGLATGSSGYFYYGDRTRDQVECQRHALRREVRPSRAEVRGGVRAQHGAEPLRLSGRRVLLRLRRRAVLRVHLQLRHLGAEQPPVGVRAGRVARRQPADHQRRRPRRHAPGWRQERRQRLFEQQLGAPNRRGS